MKMKNRILVISSTPWDDNNSFGNSYSNIFGGIEEFEIANIYLKAGSPNTNVATKFFQITEKSLIANLINKNNKTGKVVYLERNIPISQEEVFFNKIRNIRLQVFFWLRDLIWLLGRWKSKELLSFIDEFNPDLIFIPIYNSSYVSKVQHYVKEYTGKKMIGYVSDDVYTLKQFSLNPLYWIDRIKNRYFIKRTIDSCEILYTISKIQRDEYGKIFKPETKILSKGADFTEKPISKKRNNIIDFVFAGNIVAGREKSLLMIGEALNLINKNTFKARLTIYTGVSLKQSLLSKFEELKSIDFKGKVSYNEVIKRQQKADVLIHVESFSLKEKLAVRHSFSTKLVDFFKLGKCIFAVGSKDVASINSLIENDAAIIAVNKKEIYTKLGSIIENQNLIEEYAEKSWICGATNHDISRIQKVLINDIQK